MKIYIVISAHNEEDNIGITLSSLVNQDLKPAQVVVVNDNSTDRTSEIVEGFAQQYSWIKQVYRKSSDEHIPGEKIIEAFYHGYAIMEEDYEIICKYDADLVFESNYLLKLSQHFKENNRLGMAAGQCYIKKGDQWAVENLNKEDHIRGSLKAYRKACFLEMGKIAKSIGWDTLDELMAQYHGWELKVDPTLKVKPQTYGFQLQSGLLVTRGSYVSHEVGFDFDPDYWVKTDGSSGRQEFFQLHQRFLDAKRESLPFIVNAKQGKFIRNYRWRGILQGLKQNKTHLSIFVHHEILYEGSNCHDKSSTNGNKLL